MGTMWMEPGAGSREPGAGSREDPWGTAPVRRRVLGVVRNLTALDRLADVLTVLADDFRVETRFTHAAGSEFDADLSGHFRRAGMHVVPWSQACGRNFDLALSPSGNGALHELDMPVLTLSHGAGHHKHLPSGRGFGSEVAGLAHEQLVRDGRVVPSVVCLSHRDQFELLARECPLAKDRAEVVGDPCFDRLRISTPSRESYRASLGTADRELVLLASTWGPRALFGRAPELAAELVDALPGRNHQVALVLHPNVWDRHGPWQIRQWTDRARESGLVLVPPEHGWKAALVAADTVVSDHGSLGMYAATLGKRLLLAEFGNREVVAGTPREELGRRAAYLDRGLPLREQLERAAPVEGHAELVNAAFAHPGGAAGALRRVVYEQLGLSEPSWRAVARPVDPFVPE
ncbi:hypothetical protein [Actinopolyspora halophila]|uniref:hypothetical protein n=1 Tax=Actinopolyspora halophila TaxID=1850 RepID=UPI001FE018E0|nr:hypothetical protein [Actinopolyspora halophila]